MPYGQAVAMHVPPPLEQYKQPVMQYFRLCCSLVETIANCVTMFHPYPFTTTPVMLPNAVLLSPCLPVLLNVDMVIGLEGVNGLVGEFDATGESALVSQQ